MKTQTSYRNTCFLTYPVLRLSFCIGFLHTLGARSTFLDIFRSDIFELFCPLIDSLRFDYVIYEQIAKKQSCLTESLLSVMPRLSKNEHIPVNGMLQAGFS
jgi:hypothetical protein